MHVRRVVFVGISFLMAALLTFAGGCSKSDASVDATLVVPALSVSLASGRNLTSIPRDMYPDFQMSDAEVVHAPLIFGKSRNDLMHVSDPVILRESGGVWKVVSLPSLDHMEWVYVGAAFERREFWAILDSASPNRGPALYLMRSTDEGANWTLFSGIKPPAITAEFVSFTMDANGHGDVVVHQDDDTADVPRGLYGYQTVDGGKTWSGPTFTSDDLVSADPPAYPTLPETMKEIDPDHSPQSTTAPYRFPSNYQQPNNRFPFNGRGRGRRG